MIFVPNTVFRDFVFRVVCEKMCDHDFGCLVFRDFCRHDLFFVIFVVNVMGPSADPKHLNTRIHEIMTRTSNIQTFKCSNVSGPCKRQKLQLQ